MKRLAVVLLATVLLLASCGGPQPQGIPPGSAAPESIGTITVSHNGTRRETAAYQDVAGTVYLPVSVLAALLGEEPAQTVSSDGIALADAAQACTELGGSCVYDEALDALYLWTELPASALLEDECRIPYYGLGTPDDSAIPYQDFFALLDKTVQIADPSALDQWRDTLPDARASNRVMTRLEGMMGMPHLSGASFTPM